MHLISRLETHPASGHLYFGPKASGQGGTNSAVVGLYAGQNLGTHRPGIAVPENHPAVIRPSLIIFILQSVSTKSTIQCTIDQSIKKRNFTFQFFFNNLHFEIYITSHAQFRRTIS